MNIFIELLKCADLTIYERWYHKSLTIGCHFKDGNVSEGNKRILLKIIYIYVEQQ